jgi:hypothetical protein
MIGSGVPMGHTVRRVRADDAHARALTHSHERATGEATGSLLQSGGPKEPERPVHAVDSLSTPSLRIC